MKVEKISINGFEPAFRGMRNAYNSWAKSDSEFLKFYKVVQTKFKPFEEFCNDFVKVVKFDENYKPKEDLPLLTMDLDRSFEIGPNDITLAQKLIKGGPVHSKFLRFITVTMDITAPMDFWKQYDTYKVSTVSNSCSTMHTITKEKLTLDNFGISGLRDVDIKHIQSTIDYINDHVLDNSELSDLEKTRICSKILPQGFEQTRTVFLNYTTIEGMYKFRKGHTLLEWQWLCKEVFEKFPYFKEFFIDTKKE